MRPGYQHGADGLVAAAQTLGDRLQIRGDPLLLPGVQRAGAAHAAHHLVQDQQGAVAVADFTHGAEIAGRGGDAAGGGAYHRLRDEGGDLVGAEALELRLQFCGKAGGELGLRFRRMLLAIGEGRGDVAECVRQQRRVGLAAPGIAAGGQRAERVAVIALPPGDEMAAFRPPGFDEILPRQLHRRLGRF